MMNGFPAKNGNAAIFVLQNGFTVLGRIREYSSDFVHLDGAGFVNHENLAKQIGTVKDPGKLSTFEGLGSMLVQRDKIVFIVAYPHAELPSEKTQGTSAAA